MIIYQKTFYWLWQFLNIGETNLFRSTAQTIRFIGPFFGRTLRVDLIHGSDLDGRFLSIINLWIVSESRSVNVSKNSTANSSRVHLLSFSLIPKAFGTLRARFPSVSLYISNILFFKPLQTLDTWLSCTRLRSVFSLICKTIFSFWWRFSITTYFYCPSLWTICRKLRTCFFGNFKMIKKIRKIFAVAHNHCIASRPREWAAVLISWHWPDQNVVRWKFRV